MTERDESVRALLRMDDVPDHGPDFWSNLSREMGGPGGEGAVRTRRRRSGWFGQRGGLLLATAAAAALFVGGFAALRGPGTDGDTIVGPADDSTPDTTEAGLGEIDTAEPTEPTPLTTAADRLLDPPPIESDDGFAVFAGSALDGQGDYVVLLEGVDDGCARGPLLLLRNGETIEILPSVQRDTVVLDGVQGLTVILERCDRTFDRMSIGTSSALGYVDPTSVEELELDPRPTEILDIAWDLTSFLMVADVRFDVPGTGFETVTINPTTGEVLPADVAHVTSIVLTPMGIGFESPLEAAFEIHEFGSAGNVVNNLLAEELGVDAAPPLQVECAGGVFTAFDYEGLRIIMNSDGRFLSWDTGNRPEFATVDELRTGTPIADLVFIHPDYTEGPDNTFTGGGYDGEIGVLDGTRVISRLTAGTPICP